MSGTGDVDPTTGVVNGLVAAQHVPFRRRWSRSAFSLVKDDLVRRVVYEGCCRGAGGFTCRIYRVARIVVRNRSTSSALPPDLTTSPGRAVTMSDPFEEEQHRLGRCVELVGWVRFDESGHGRIGGELAECGPRLCIVGCNGVIGDASQRQQNRQ